MTEVESQWLKRLRKGEEGATRELVEAYASSLRRYLVSMLKNPQDAEELSQDVLLHFLKGLASFRGECSIKTYLFRIAHNLALNHLSSATARYETLPGELSPVAAGGESPHSAVQSGERVEALRKALTGLPPQQRAVVTLKTWLDFTFKEIASVLSLKEGTVKAHYFFGIRSLKKLMEVIDES